MLTLWKKEENSGDCQNCKRPDMWLNEESTISLSVWSGVGWFSTNCYPASGLWLGASELLDYPGKPPVTPWPSVASQFEQQIQAGTNKAVHGKGNSTLQKAQNKLNFLQKCFFGVPKCRFRVCVIAHQNARIYLVLSKVYSLVCGKYKATTLSNHQVCLPALLGRHCFESLLEASLKYSCRG